MKRRNIVCVFATLLLVLFVNSAYADTINIPADYTTIQAGINASTNGDTVLVQPGTYVENINYNGKNITVGSLFLTTADTSYISQTVIDGNQNGSVVRFENGEDSTAILTGFTVTNGSNEWGGGIYCYPNSSPRIKDNVIEGNIAKYGGGMYCRDNSNPYLKNVDFIENYATGFALGGGEFTVSLMQIPT